jgi:HEPN domain-containing protein
MGKKAYLTMYDGYLLGRGIRYLRNAVKGNWTIGSRDEGFILGILYDIVDNLKGTTLSDISERAREEAEKIENKYLPPYDFSLDREDGKDLLEEIIKWEEALNRELPKDRRILATHEGLISKDKIFELVENPKSLFENAEAWVWLESVSERAQNDLREATGSLAIGCYTAATFCALRTVEDCLRIWYENIEGEKMEKGWGTVLNKLVEEYESEKEKPDVLVHLGHLKTLRDTVAHPDALITGREAETILMDSVETITKVYTEVSKRKAT